MEQFGIDFNPAYKVLAVNSKVFFEYFDDCSINQLSFFKCFFSASSPLDRSAIHFVISLSLDLRK